MLNIANAAIRQSVLILAFSLTALTVAPAVQAREELSDQEISNAVDDRLAFDILVPSWNIDVSTSKGFVTLTGTVPNILDKERAEKIAGTVKGVKGVINTITVASPAGSDTDIQRSVEIALARDPATESWETEASVDDGVVTLTGTVESWQEKLLAGNVARDVKGVRDVRNDIRVEFPEQRSDAEILRDIQGDLRWDAYVDDALVDVTVEDGKVTLNGVVGSLAEKLKAGRDAWVTGVDSVDNNLQVEWWERDERLRTGKYVSRSDLEIEAAVEDALADNPRVVANNVAVESDRGDVTLRGTVNSLKALRVAEQEARSVVGVWRVDNRLKVRTTKTIGDDALEESITAALRDDPYVDRFKISVTARNGVVHLFGDVDSGYEKNRADDVAARQPGVVLVKNHLTVNEPFIDVYDPYVDEFSSSEYMGTSNNGIPTAKDDWEIKEDIENELYWSPFVDADEISVEVEDGEATLTGTVDTWRERQAATDNALEGGAVLVDNNLKVQFGPDYYLP